MTIFRLIWRLPSARVAGAVLFAVVVLLAVAVVATFGDALSPLDPLAQDPANALAGPSAHHSFGTDYLGRDVLSRLVAGTRRSVVGALEAVGTALLLGVVPGLASLWLGRAFEWVTLRVADALMTLPFIIFAVAVTGALGNGLTQAMLALGVLFAPLFFRVTRAAGLSLTRAQYVEAAELFGASRWRILRTHVWGKVLPTVAVTAAQATGSALLAVSSLTFLGIGVAPPAPTWGGVLASELGFLSQQPWAPLIPATLIMGAVAALNTVADAIRDNGAGGALLSDVDAAAATPPATTPPASGASIPREPAAAARHSNTGEGRCPHLRLTSCAANPGRCASTVST